MVEQEPEIEIEVLFLFDIVWSLKLTSNTNQIKSQQQTTGVFTDVL